MVDTLDKQLKAPDRIFASVNGASTQLPSMQRQLLGGWRECAEDYRPCTEYIRADIHARLTAENERLREALSRIAAGDGVYGVQAGEYKNIARAALSSARILSAISEEVGE